jgi:hypothetical protein
MKEAFRIGVVTIYDEDILELSQLKTRYMPNSKMGLWETRYRICEMVEDYAKVGDYSKRCILDGIREHIDGIIKAFVCEAVELELGKKGE